MRSPGDSLDCVCAREAQSRPGVIWRSWPEAAQRHRDPTSNPNQTKQVTVPVDGPVWSGLVWHAWSDCAACDDGLSLTSPKRPSSLCESVYMHVLDAPPPPPLHPLPLPPPPKKKKKDALAMLNANTHLRCLRMFWHGATGQNAVGAGGAARHGKARLSS